MGGIWEDYVLPAAHAAGGVAETALHGASGIGGTIGRSIPIAGAVIGGGQAIYHGYEAANTEGSERWDHIGAATLGALGAIPLVGAYTGAAELGWNGAAAIDHGGIHEAEEHGDLANQAVGQGMHALYNAPSDIYNWMDRGVRDIYGGMVPGGL